MASNHWTCQICAAYNNQRDRRCLSCNAAKYANPSSHSAGKKKWTCYRCTYTNDGFKSTCGACSAPNPGSGPKHTGKQNGHANGDSDDEFDFDFEEDSGSSRRQHSGSSRRHGKPRGRRTHHRRHDDSDDDLDDEVRIVLLGKTGSGKSATGNTILNGDYFDSKISGISVTSRCTKKSASRFGKQILLVDTPGIFDTSTPNDKVQREIVKCIGMTSPGPHAFLLVLGLTRFTQEEEEAVNHFIEYFGEDVVDYMIVLFTRKDDLEYEGKTVDDHVRNVPQSLKDIIRRCGGRKIAFNNRAAGARRDQQVQELLEIVEEIKQNNRGKCYTNAMYDEAEIVMRQREQEIKRERRERKQRERRQIEREIERKYKQDISRHQKNEEDLEMRIAEMESNRDFHDQKARKINDDIDRLRDKIAQEKKYGKVDPTLLRRLKELEDDLERVRSKKSGDKVKKELEEMREELKKTKKRAKKMQQEKDRQIEARLQEQERRFAEMQRPREEARHEVETNKGNTGDALVGGIVAIGKAIWKGIQLLF